MNDVTKKGLALSLVQVVLMICQSVCIIVFALTRVTWLANTAATVAVLNMAILAILWRKEATGQWTLESIEIEDHNED